MKSENRDLDSAKDFDRISLKALIFKIHEWINYLFSKWLIIVGVGVLGGVLGFAYAYIKKPVYTATTTFVLEDEKTGGIGSLAGLASIAGVDLIGGGGGIFQGDNILQLYKSRTMLVKTLLSLFEFKGKKQLLVDKYIDLNKLREKWAIEPELANLQFHVDSSQMDNDSSNRNRLRDSVLNEIVIDINKNYLTVAKPDKRFSTIQVDVNAEDEFFAKAFNDELVKNVNKFYVQTKTKKSLQNVDILQHKTDSIRSEMNRAIYTAVAVGDATPNLNPTRQVQRVAPAQKAQYSAEANKSILAELVKNLELTKFSLLKETPLIQVIDQPVYPLKNDKIGKGKAVLLGGIIGGFTISLILTIRRLLKQVLA